MTARSSFQPLRRPWQAYADVGYRAIDMDYEDGSGLQYVGLDMLISGPQLGVVFTF